MSGELKECGILSKGAVEKIVAHYCHAVEKHTYFCDRLMPDTNKHPHDWALDGLRVYRLILADQIRRNNVISETVLMCELYEVYEAIARNNKTAAVEECYDCIAVLLRMVDVLEGRQELGKPDSAKKGDVQ